MLKINEEIELLIRSQVFVYENKLRKKYYEENIFTSDEQTFLTKVLKIKKTLKEASNMLRMKNLDEDTKNLLKAKREEKKEEMKLLVEVHLANKIARILEETPEEYDERLFQEQLKKIQEREAK